MGQAYYFTTVDKFLSEDTNTIKGHLDRGISEHPQIWTIQFTSWESSIELFKRQLKDICISIPEASGWTILLEYEIPRLLSRVDFVLLARDLIFVIEYKHDRASFESADVRQAEDYALDLKDFHFQSRDRIIIPVLLCPNAPSVKQEIRRDENNFVQATIKANKANLSGLLISAYAENTGSEPIDTNEWINSKYSPTPTIIQAAQALFAGQKVEAITNSGAENLTYTMDYVVELIKNAQIKKEKIICFITGVPGAGKTLVGLNVIHRKEFIEDNESNAAYFSGNGPLVEVLREALTRDEYERNLQLFLSSQLDEKPSKSLTQTKVQSKIQNLHHFIKDGGRSGNAPHERIVVFDEAQRCWDADNFYNKSVQSRVKTENPIRKSEAESIFEIMDRHSEWAVIIALVGNGQEINTGEAGIGEWGTVLKEKYNHWHVHISPELLSRDSDNAVNKLFDTIPSYLDIKTSPCLHLSVSQRSFKATNLNDWVNAVIDNKPAVARDYYDLISREYPVVITRNLQLAKKWLYGRKQGNKRIGLVASSGGLRLRTYGINTKEVIDVPNWFLNDESDVRSSYYLEIVATEYKIQGLEIDWCGVCWDADLRRTENDWDFRSFKGTKWGHVHSQNDKQFLLNKYRVLLTRAREGMVIWIPEGDINDMTRSSYIYDPIFRYLKECGINEI